MIDFKRTTENGFYTYIIEYVDENINPGMVTLFHNQWNFSEIVSTLIRTKYSQNAVEAIINNHFLNIAEWLDKKFKGEVIDFKDPEYDELQEWRKICKQWAKEALEKYPPID